MRDQAEGADRGRGGGLTFHQSMFWSLLGKKNMAMMREHAGCTYGQPWLVPPVVNTFFLFLFFFLYVF